MHGHLNLRWQQQQLEHSTLVQLAADAFDFEQKLHLHCHVAGICKKKVPANSRKWMHCRCLNLMHVYLACCKSTENTWTKIVGGYSMYYALLMQHAIWSSWLIQWVIIVTSLQHVNLTVGHQCGCWPGQTVSSICICDVKFQTLHLPDDAGEFILQLM